jgi:hypothetical protein
MLFVILFRIGELLFNLVLLANDMPDATQAIIDPSIWHLLASKLLDWPFLLFIVCLIVIFKGGKKIADLFDRRKVEVEVAGSRLSIGDAVQELDLEAKQASDDFRKNQQMIDIINSRLDILEMYCDRLKSTSVKLAEKSGLKTADLPIEDEGFMTVLTGLGKSQGTRILGLARSFEPRPISPTRTDTTDQPPSNGEAAQKRQDVIFRRMIAALSNSKFKWRTIERLAIEAGISEAEANDILAAHHPNDVVLSKSKTGKTIARLPDNEAA